MRILCDVYKSAGHDEMYLYVDQKVGLSRVPVELLERFGRPEKALTMVLTEDRRLARENAGTVLKNIDEKGYHLQLPPQRKDLLAEFKAARERAGEQG